MMKFKKSINLGLLTSLLLVSSSGFAKSEMFVAPFSGYSFGASDMTFKDEASIESGLSISDSSHFGFMAGVVTKDPGDIYFLYSRQSSDLKISDNSSESPISKLDTDYYHIGGSLYFPKGDLKPYVTASLGMTQLRPSDSYSNESRFSMGFGAGIEYQITQAFSAFADVRGFATFVNSDNALFCSGGGGCLWSISSDIMWQGQGNLGVKLKF